MSKSSLPEPVGDEMLSAYVDGELSPSEVLVVERWLNSSPQARQKVAEFRRLSGLLQDLPREELPEEFASEVMSRSERQMLLPVDRKIGPVSIARRLRFWAVSVGLPAAAACLLIAIQWGQPKGGPVDERGAPPPAPGRAVAKGIAQNTPTFKRGDFTPDVKSVEPPLPPGHAPPRAVAEDHGGTERLLAPKVEGPAPAPPSDAGANGGVETLTPEIASPEGEKRPGEKDSVATVLGQITQLNAAGRIPVVRIFVVDRQDGLEVLQVLLEGQKIRREGQTADGSRTPADAEQRALFVVASAQELTSALKALEASSGGMGRWQLSEPVELARFDQASQSQMADVMAMVAEGRTEFKAGMAAGAAAVAALDEPANVKAEPAPAATRGAPSERSRPLRATSPDRSSATEREKAGLADVPPAKPVRRGMTGGGRQLVVTMSEAGPLSRDTVRRGAPSPDPERTADEPGNSRNAEPSAKPGDRVARSGPAGRQPPMQVLFVIERQEAAPKREAPAKDGAGSGAA